MKATRFFMRKYRRPYRFTHAVYCNGSKVASVVHAFDGMHAIAWHVDYFQHPRYQEICKAILAAAPTLQAVRNVLIYEM